MANWLTIDLLFGTLLVAAFVSNGLLALWAATSSRPWLLRSAVVLTVLSPLWLIAYELWIAFILQTLGVVACSLFWHWRTSTRRHFASQFSLRTLLVIPVMVAVITVTVTRVVPNLAPQTVGTWTTLGLNGVCGGCAVLLGVWAFASRRKQIAWPSALVLCLVLSAAMAWLDWLFVSVTFWNDWPPRHAVPVMFNGIPSAPYPALAWFAILPAVATTIWLMVRLHFAGWNASTITVQQRRTKGQLASRCVFGLLLAGVMLPPLATVWRLLRPTPMPGIPSPAPNGFRDITETGFHLQFSEILGRMASPCSTEELAAEIAGHAWAYERLRLGLSRSIQVRDWTKKGKTTEVSYLWRAGTELDDAMSAAHALIREAELAQRQNRFSDAARIAVEDIFLGQAITRKGLLADYNCGLEIEDMGNQLLHQVVPHLDAYLCQELVATLIEVDQEREPLVDVSRRDRIWHENTGEWFLQLVSMLDAIVWDGEEWRPPGLLEKEAITRMLILELALHAYQLEHGCPPESLEQLVPEFLSALPIDPFDPNGGPFRYPCSDDGPIVYSVGPDGDDDGGRPSAPYRWGGLDLDSEGDFRLDVHLVAEEEDGDEDSAEDEEP